MGQHLLDGDPAVRVLLQGHPNEVPRTARPLVHDEVVGHDPVDLRSLGDFEGIVAGQKLVGEGADGPGIYLLIVSLARNYLGWKVQRGATYGRPDVLGAVDRPSEVAYLDGTLHRLILTWLKIMFSGLMSRWMICFSCMWWMPNRICLTRKEVVSSVSLALPQIKLNNCPSAPTSITRYIF